MNDQRINRAGQHRPSGMRTLRLTLLMRFSTAIGFVFFAPAQMGGSESLISGAKQTLATVVSAAFFGLAVELFLRFREKEKVNGLRFGTHDLLIAIFVVAIAFGAIVALRKL